MKKVMKNFLKVDVQYPENLNDLDIDLMILHARMKIKKKKMKILLLIYMARLNMLST